MLVSLSFHCFPRESMERDALLMCRLKIQVVFVQSFKNRMKSWRKSPSELPLSTVNVKLILILMNMWPNSSLASWKYAISCGCLYISVCRSSMSGFRVPNLLKSVISQPSLKARLFVAFVDWVCSCAWWGWNRGTRGASDRSPP